MDLRSVLTAFIGLITISAMGDLPGLSAPPRPVTTITMAKSGNNIVLSWTTSPQGNYNYFVYRGIAHPEFKAETLIASLTNGETSYTDTGAIIRTRQGYPINEFYKVYAIPKDSYPLAAKAVEREDVHRILDKSVDIAVEIPQGNVIKASPSVKIDTIDFPLSMIGTSKADLDIYNLPFVDGSKTIRVNPAETYTRTVAHIGYQAGAYLEPQEQDITIETNIRQIPLPSVSRNGNLITIQWEQLTEDFENTITAIEVIRTYLGVGDNEPSTLVAVLPKDATSTEDDISSVTSGYYCFWQLRVIYKDGSRSDMSPSSEWIKR